MPSGQPAVRIPPEFRENEFKSEVRVEASIAADGSSSVRLRTSTGNPELDAWVLQYVQSWTWEPAIQGGQPVASVRKFKVQLEVQ